MNTEQRLAALGAAVPEILIPKEGIDLARWTVIACDQFTHDRDYWEGVRSRAGNAPSALRCVFPEVFLGDPGREQRITGIHKTMTAYLEMGLFVPRRGCVYVERDTPLRVGRRGLLLCLDLEHYDWSGGAATLIRPTEGTVPERLPVRMAVRRNAPLELSHILVLIDDESGALFAGLDARAKASQMLYDTALSPDSGRARGWLLDKDDDLAFLASGLETLSRAAAARESAKTAAPFLYAVGDGNHSLGAAKGVWEEYKKAHEGEPDAENHPCRWALVEIENLHDPALVFQPIHRFVYGAGRADLERLLAAMPSFSVRQLAGDNAREELLALVREQTDRTRLGLALRESGGLVFYLAETGPMPLTLDRIQPLLELLCGGNPGLSLDYIHGADEIFRLAAGPGGLGIILPPFDKRGLFRTVAKRGILPRKAFSLGEAAEKRFYLECRRLFG
jgi:hypothetical protein